MSARTLVLEIALPDFYTEDFTDEMLAEWYDGSVFDAVLSEETGLCSDRVRLALVIGSKSGTTVERVYGRLVGARLADPVEHSDDDRLDHLIGDVSAAGATK